MTATNVWKRRPFIDEAVGITSLIFGKPEEPEQPAAEYFELR
jgi:hypothetical protein